MPRTVKEWISKHDDQAIPARVRLRVFDAHNGICALSGVPINAGDKWELDHIKPLWDGGEHRESNLQPVLAKPHRAKSAKDKTAKAQSDKLRKKHVGVTRPKAKIKSKGFAGRKSPKIEKHSLAPRALFEGIG